MRILCNTFLSLLVAAAIPAAGTAVDPALFDSLHWRLIGPFRGGRVLAVTGVPGEPEHFYFGAVNGGVWETIDSGRNNMPAFHDTLSIEQMRDVAGYVFQRLSREHAPD